MSVEISEYHLKDRSIRSIFNAHPKELHAALGLPGVFVDKCEIVIITHDNRELKPDMVMLVNPDGKTITEPTIIILEHQSYIVDMAKIKIIKEYQDEIGHKTHKPVYVIIITPIEPEKCKSDYRKSPSDIFIPKYIQIDIDEIREMLKYLENKIKKQEPLTDSEALLLIVALVFSPSEHDKEIFDKVVELLKKEKTVSGEIRLDIVEVVEKFNGKTFDLETRMELENMSYTDIETRKKSMRILYGEELAQKDKEIADIKKEYKEGLTELNKMEDLNPKAKEILQSLMLL